MQAPDWVDFSKSKLGRYAEYLVKTRFVAHGFAIYVPEIDERGVDFIAVRTPGRHYDVQVKSIRTASASYVFFPKAKFQPRDRLLAAVVLFTAGGEPAMYLIPSRAWESPDPVLVSRDYPGSTKSQPEWGVQISKRNAAILEPHRFETSVATLE